MTELEAIQARHSVRSFLPDPLTDELKHQLTECLFRCNLEGNLHMELVTDEPGAFSGPLAHYGKFSGVRNYLVIMGRQADDLQERAGYWGEKFVLTCQMLGLNTCWVGLTFSKRRLPVHPAKDEKLVCVIALGYGATPGTGRRSKSMADVTNAAYAPEWFARGVDAALLAPTAMNHQKFRLDLEGDKVRITAMRGPFSRVDLGIVQSHFEIGSGRARSCWV